MTDSALDAASPTTTGGGDRATARIAAEAKRRRTFAVISHPDAGKSTLTEALALHARVITEAGAIHGKAGRRSTVSDWMEMEKARGISITSTALQFPYRDCVINLLDTPGHADFSEDTYRVLTAVDCAVMLIDAAKGLEPQTLKLFQVCKHRGIPIITVINKWDRPGRHALELMDEIGERIGLRTTPLTWPVGIAGDFQGVLDRRSGMFIRFTRTAGGATAAPEEHIAASDAHAAAGVDWDTAIEESDLLSADGSDFDEAQFRSGAASPVLFTSAALNFGVNQLLDVLVELAPAPDGAVDVDGARRAVTSPFSAFVFKVQAGMDSAHRDRIAANLDVFDFELDADSEQLFRVMMNLCRNSVEAMRADTDPATVKRLSITAARMGTTALIGVEDTGPGLPAKARENLFSAFRGSARAGGTGLGLAIAQELVRAHGGTLELREDRGIGAHFEIRLPDAPVSLEQERVRRSRDRDASGAL